MKEYSLKRLSEITQSTLFGDPNHCLTGVANLQNATSSDLSFLSNSRYLPLLETTKAGAIFVFPDTPRTLPGNYLVTDHPSRAFQTFVDLLFPPISSGFTGIHKTASVHPSATLGAGVTIGPSAVVDAHTVIGDNTSIGAGCYIGPETQIGSHCLIHPRVVIRERCRIGNRVVFQPGAVIGSCGFGFTTEETGTHEKLRQVGSVVIEDDVEIGANTTIDRARFETTVIGRGSKIDNLVQIGHGVKVGKNNIIVAQTGIAGSTETGSQVILAGQVAVAGHIKIADNVVVAGKSGISKSISQPGKYGGIPALPLAQYNRHAVHLRKIEQLFSRIEALEKSR